MVRSTGFTSDICSNQNAMSYIGLNNYCSNTLLNNNTWREGICDSAYFENVLNFKVSAMTSDTCSEGVAICSSTEVGSSAYKAFDNNSTTAWGSQSLSSFQQEIQQWVGFHFNNSQKIYKIYAAYGSWGGSSARFDVSYTIETSSNGSSWTDTNIHTPKLDKEANTLFSPVTVNINLNTAYIRLRAISGYHTYFGDYSNQVTMADLQFYCRQNV